VTRIAYVTEPDPEVAHMFDRPMVSPVPAPNALKLLANHPNLLTRFATLAAIFAGETSLPAHDVELVILRSAWRSGCEYEWSQHYARGERAGVDVESLRTEDGPWSDEDATLVALVDEIHRDAVATDDTWERLRGRYDDRQLLEVLLLPGFYRMFAGLMNTVQVPVDEGLPGWTG